MNLELHITTKTGVFNLDPEKNTYQTTETVKKISVQSQKDFDILMLGIFNDWVQISDREYKRIIVGCSNVYSNENIFVCVNRTNNKVVRKEAMARSYIKEGKAILMGSPDRFHAGKSPAGYPQMIVKNIIARNDYKDCDEVYLNTELGVEVNPEYQWETDDSVCDSIFNS